MHLPVGPSFLCMAGNVLGLRSLQVLVYVSREFLESVNARIHHERPLWRKEQGSLHIVGGMALLISDHSEFPAFPSMWNQLVAVMSLSQEPRRH